MRRRGLEETVPHSEDFEDAAARLKSLVWLLVEETSGMALHIKASRGLPELSRRCCSCWGGPSQCKQVCYVAIHAPESAADSRRKDD